jgi:16S rRNA (cytidine1402-2'-O)-methyltransferase
VPSGTLYLVATPIGNLEDITLRALRVLREVSLIACEDTRRTRKLLNHYAIHAATLPYHRFNEARVLRSLLQALRSGKDLALVTDGGTPSVSDPGMSLAAAVRREGMNVVPVPGPSALLAAVAASGLPSERFTFFGFLPPRSGERQRFLDSLRLRPETLVFFDSPRRVAGSLQEMSQILGNRPAAICREMTKVHEEFRLGTLPELAASLLGETLRGEVTLVIGGAAPPDARPADPLTLREEVEARILKEGLSRRDAMRAVAILRGIPRHEVYRALRDPRPPMPGQDDDGSE